MERAIQLNPHLSFHRQCAEAFKFYEQHLGGKIESISNYARPQLKDQTPPEWRNTILYATVPVGNTVLMGSDTPPDLHEEPKGFYLTVMIKDPADAERAFHALAENGKVHMPIQETFWPARFGKVVDRFGIPWMINFLKTTY